jgi:hypothetical protein
VAGLRRDVRIAARTNEIPDNTLARRVRELFRAISQQTFIETALHEGATVNSRLRWADLSAGTAPPPDVRSAVSSLAALTGSFVEIGEWAMDNPLGVTFDPQAKAQFAVWHARATTLRRRLADPAAGIRQDVELANGKTASGVMTELRQAPMPRTLSFVMHETPAILALEGSRAGHVWLNAPFHGTIAVTRESVTVSSCPDNLKGFAKSQLEECFRFTNVRFE